MRNFPPVQNTIRVEKKAARPPMSVGRIDEPLPTTNPRLIRKKTPAEINWIRL